ncbi:MAG: chemotaxis protein CheA [Candidatus Acidiferrales bacterium]
MNFFSEEQAAELRELMYESSEELLQSLNDAGLELEKHPADAESMRSVRRAVHTLKGDSAACGFHELSELAHELEDMLTPQLAESAPAAVAEVVLTAADTFHAMLAAYRGKMQPPSGDALRAQLKRLIDASTAPSPPEASAQIGKSAEWTEYEQRVIREAMRQGASVYNVSLAIDRANQMPAAAVQMIRGALEKSGKILAMRPQDGAGAEFVSQVQAVISSKRTRESIARCCRIPAVVTAIAVEPAAIAAGSQVRHDALGVLLKAEAEAVAAENLEAAEHDAPHTQAQLLTGSGSAENILRVDSTRIDELLNLVGELIIGKSMLHRAVQEFETRFPKDPLRARLADSLSLQSRVLGELQKSVLKVRMVPVEQLFRRVPRIVRDVAKTCGHEVDVEAAGQNTDLDKGILDSLAEPLSHLVRNAVDHGIEPAAERIAAGKPPRGTIRLNAYHRGNQVVIEISDDGRGIDRTKTLRRAVEGGFVKAEEGERLSDSEIVNLIFQPGFTTSECVTEVSGRGIGMDVVVGVLERLKGTVTVESVPGKSTTFQLSVPLTLASVSSLLFRSGKRLYAIELCSVAEIARVDAREIHVVDNREIIELRNQILLLVRLESPAMDAPPKSNKMFLLVVNHADRKFGLVVDSLLGEEDLVIKALDEKYLNSDLLSGASILGDGAVVMVLNVAALAGKAGKSMLLRATA